MPTEPSACGWCGVPEREHMQRWTKGAGWHVWSAPTHEQRKERMVARAAENNSTPAPEMPRPPAVEALGTVEPSNADTGRGTGVREAHEGAQAVDTIARILVGSDWDEGVRITDIGSRETVARMAEQIVAALWPDVDGWTIHAGLDGDVSIGHHTSGALLTGKDIPVGAVLAFIADQPLTERTTT